MLKVNHTCLHRGPVEQVCHTGQDPVAILRVWNYSLTSAATEFQPWLGVHIARVCLWRVLIAQQYLLPPGLGDETVGHFSRESLHVAASACVGFLSQSSDSSQHFMTLKPGVQGHLFAQASNFVLYIYTIFGHFWRNQKRHVIVCFWILHMRLSILHNGMLIYQK